MKGSVSMDKVIVNTKNELMEKVIDLTKSIEILTEHISMHQDVVDRLTQKRDYQIEQIRVLQSLIETLE